MRRVVDDEKLILRVCELYYNQSLGQSEVAKALNLSRPTVSKMLAKAKEEGIVRIVISDIVGRNHLDTEHQLEQKYALKTAIVADSFDDSIRQSSELGKATARFLERKLHNNYLVGVSMGGTLHYIAQHVSQDYSFHGLRFVSMVGGVGEVAMEMHSNNIAQSLANAFGGESIPFHAPAMVSRIQTKNELLQEKSIARTLELASNVDIAISGIGAPDIDSTIIKTGYFSKEMIDDFAAYKICGDICLNFYDTDGNVASYEPNKLVVGVNINNLKNAQWSVGVAGGIRKADAIKGALAGGYINALVTDYECAKLLLDNSAE